MASTIRPPNLTPRVTNSNLRANTSVVGIGLPPITTTTLASSAGLTVTVNNIDTVALADYMTISNAASAQVINKITGQIVVMTNNIRDLRETVNILTTQYADLAKVVQSLNTQLSTVYSFLASEQELMSMDLSGLAGLTEGPF